MLRSIVSNAAEMSRRHKQELADGRRQFVIQRDQQFLFSGINNYKS